VQESAEELFEVLACYFPVTFTPPPGDPNRITRAELAAGLEASLAAEPLFAPHLVPLAMEKLSSTLRCVDGCGGAALMQH
jgi:DNA repair/transcription protein MET18/MMS19